MSTPRLRPSRSLVLNGIIAICAVALLGALVATLVFFANGGRMFVIETPSMGTSAPVGTLVLTQPTSIAALTPGEIVSFHPPTAPGQTYTHRVVKISGDSLTTKGDINGTDDPWTLRSADVIGKVGAILPGVGWLVRALPILAIGVALVLLLTQFVKSLEWRAALRVVGASLVVSIAAWILRPFTGFELLQTSIGEGTAEATVVSTGLLPIRVTAEHGNHVDLLSGQVGLVQIPSYVEDGYYRISSALQLDLVGWILFVIVCCLPFVAVLIFGLPAEPKPEEQADGESYP